MDKAARPHCFLTPRKNLQLQWIMPMSQVCQMEKVAVFSTHFNLNYNGASNLSKFTPDGCCSEQIRIRTWVRSDRTNTEGEAMLLKVIIWNETVSQNLFHSVYQPRVKWTRSSEIGLVLVFHHLICLKLTWLTLQVTQRGCLTFHHANILTAAEAGMIP